MRLKLDYDDALRFSSMSHPTLGSYRTLVVKVGGKAFSVWQTMDEMRTLACGYFEEIDRALVASMERMLTDVFMKAVTAVPEGVDLLEPGGVKCTRK